MPDRLRVVYLVLELFFPFLLWTEAFSLCSLTIVVLLVNERILTLDGMLLDKFTSVHPIPLPAKLT